jgi:hypothetical protein
MLDNFESTFGYQENPPPEYEAAIQRNPSPVYDSRWQRTTTIVSDNATGDNLVVPEQATVEGMLNDDYATLESIETLTPTTHQELQVILDDTTRGERMRNQSRRSVFSWNQGMIPPYEAFALAEIDLQSPATSLQSVAAAHQYDLDACRLPATRMCEADTLATDPAPPYSEIPNPDEEVRERGGGSDENNNTFRDDVIS